jgi:hypothetical protein
LGREREESVKFSELDEASRKVLSTGECLVPQAMKSECSGTIVSAHTVPRSGSLAKIARTGHVYSFIPSLGNLIKHGGRLQPQLVGVRRASTFTGFCSFHDNSIFSKIESQAFRASPEQCFLLAYRALARDIYNKRAQATVSKSMRQMDRGKPIEQQLATQAFVSLYELGTSAGLRDLEYYKSIYDDCLLAKDFGSVRAYVIELNYAPPIMCSSSTFPEQDFSGNQLQDLMNLESRSHLLNFTAFYGGSCGIIVFTWLSGSDATCCPFISSLRALSPDRMTDGLIRFLFEFSDNLHIQPDWWENLAPDKKKALIDRRTDSSNPTLAREPSCLADNGINFDNWPVSNSRTIGF